MHTKKYVSIVRSSRVEMVETDYKIEYWTVVDNKKHGFYMKLYKNSREQYQYEYRNDEPDGFNTDYWS